MLSTPPIRPSSRPAKWTTRLLRRAAPVALIAGVLLAGCSHLDEFPPACPELKMLKDGVDLSSFDARGQDVTDLVLSARITAVPASCEPGGRGKVKATLHVEMQVNRGPAMQGRIGRVPYFVTIMDGDKVLEQKDYVAGIMFPENVDQVPFTGDDIEMLFPVTAQKSAAAYTIYVSLRLTPQQLRYNRERGAS